MTESADSRDPVAKPHDWDTCVSVAYLRLMGATQKAAADAAGCGERSIRDWENCSWWPVAQKEAGERWLSGVMAKARTIVLEDLDLAHAFKVLERQVPELAPPKTRTELTGENGGPIAVTYEAAERAFLGRLSELADNREASGLVEEGSGEPGAG